MSARRSTMPPTITCDNCGLSYYQTSAAHVCSEYRKGETMTTTTKDHTCDRWQAPHRKNRYCINPQPATTTEHEPAARGVEAQWHFIPDENGNYDVYNYSGSRVCRATSMQSGERIVDDHNSHTALVEQRDRLLEAIREVAIPSLRYCEGKYDHDDQARLNLEALVETVEHEQGDQT